MGEWQPTLSDHGEPERVRGDRVSWTYFRTLGVKPALGRDFLEGEDLPGTNQVVILSHGLWERRYGGDSSIVGKAISINGNPMTVAGVMPASFDNAPSPLAEIWRVLGYLNQPYACRTCHHLRDDRAHSARREPPHAPRPSSIGIKSQLMQAYPNEYAAAGVIVGRVQDEITKQIRPALLALTGAVLLVLLIAIANVVSLQLARAIRRAQEFAVRSALGASRARMIRQLLTEGLLLAALGGMAGVLVAYLSLPLLVQRLPGSLPRLDAIHVDVGALGVVATIVLLLAIVMGLAPARGRLTQSLVVARLGPTAVRNAEPLHARRARGGGGGARDDAARERRTARPQPRSTARGGRRLRHIAPAHARDQFHGHAIRERHQRLRLPRSRARGRERASRACRASRLRVSSRSAAMSTCMALRTWTTFPRISSRCRSATAIQSPRTICRRCAFRSRRGVPSRQRRLRKGRTRWRS